MMFLSPLLREPARGWVLVEAASARVLATHVDVAVDSASRRRGLLGRDGLVDAALVIAPCNAVHTFFMRFPIDVLFVTREGRVIRATRRLPAWRMALSPRAFAVIELAAGASDGIRAGDQVALRPS